MLDTSVPINSARRGLSETGMLRELCAIAGLTEHGTSTIALTELLHGIYYAKTLKVRQRLEQFVFEFQRDVAIYPYSLEIAELAGRIGGEQAAMGQTIPPIDLMIGATALFHGYSLLTTNLRHFRMIPNLTVIPF